MLGAVVLGTCPFRPHLNPDFIIKCDIHLELTSEKVAKQNENNAWNDKHL